MWDREKHWIGVGLAYVRCMRFWADKKKNVQSGPPYCQMIESSMKG